MLNDIPMSQYTTEIVNDLPKLVEMYPDGIYLSHLTSYYGETIRRTLRAVHLLQMQQKVKLYRAKSNAHFILPWDYEPKHPTEVLALTPLQRSLLRYLVNLCNTSAVFEVRTSYSQLARVLESSYGGMRAALSRLESSHFIRIKQASQRGRQHQLHIIVLAAVDDCPSFDS